MGERLLLALPAAAVAVVLWLVLFASGPGSVTGVEVLGGDVSPQPVRSLLLRAVKWVDGRRQPLSGVDLVLEARAGGHRARWRGTTHATGCAEARLDWPEGAVGTAHLQIWSAGQPARRLAWGRANALPPTPTPTPPSGGWLSARSEGELRLDVALQRGVLAIPFAGQLLLRVGGEATERAGAFRLRLRARGATLVGTQVDRPTATPREPVWTTDADGRLTIGLLPREHAITLEVEASAPDGRSGRLYVGLPVMPGAIDARWDGDALRLHSPIPREHAFVSVRNRDQRLWGAIVSLQADAHGGALARVPLPKRVLHEMAESPSWAVTSSAPDKRSSGAVGWPMLAGDVTGPRSTLTVVDDMLVDGPALRRADQATSRRRKRFVAAVLSAAIGLAIAVLLWRRVYGASRDGRPMGARHPVLLRATLTTTPWFLALAIACLLAGLASLALFGALHD